MVMDVRGSHTYNNHPDNPNTCKKYATYTGNVHPNTNCYNCLRNLLNCAVVTGF